MKYQSTRSLHTQAVSAAEAIKNGLAPDGGLYMPTEIPAITKDELTDLLHKDYPTRAAYILKKFLDDYTEEELLEDCRAAYGEDRFPGGAAPLSHPSRQISMLELWHGPTSAFKDMALQIMPRLLSRALVKTGEKRTAMILVATSGDTGKAALEGYRDIPQIKIKVFYPADGVSRVQKLQMITQKGENVEVAAIRGNFDDAQSGVKRIFADREIAEQLNARDTFLSSANSINWGRLAPQIVYYVSVYLDMVLANRITMGEIIDVCVPTGNFGNIFAAFIAKKMGVPLGKLVCASNKNNVLTDFLESGTYNRNRTFHTTISPSMDILISSNLERLLYLTVGAEKTAEYMNKLSSDGIYTLAASEIQAIRENFYGAYTDEETTKETIRRVFAENGFLIDPHTAVAYHAAEQYVAESNSSRPIVVASTASPFKFAADVLCALTKKDPVDPLAALDELSHLSHVEIPMPLSGIGERTVRFPAVIDAVDMADSVLAFANA
ncbi:MAG: threonine synthase [Clostridia bacterium]|nr:threonine synthase [Clostridia bacterium]